MPWALRNLMLITGDPGRVGDYPGRDRRLRRRLDRPDQPRVAAQSRLRRRRPADRRAHRRFTSACRSIPPAPNLDEELRRFEYKVEAGAEFVVTRPVFDVAAFDAFLKRIERRGCRSSPGSCRSRARATPSSWPTKCRASVCRSAARPHAAGGRTADEAAAEGRCDRAGNRDANCAAVCRGCRFRRPPATSTPRWRSLMDFADRPEV